eukprot:3223465-Rhodomonas_salina.1
MLAEGVSAVCSNLDRVTNPRRLIEIPLSITLDGAQVDGLRVLIDRGSEVPTLLRTSIASQLGAETRAGPSLRSGLDGDTPRVKPAPPSLSASDITVNLRPRLSSPWPTTCTVTPSSGPTFPGLARRRRRLLQPNSPAGRCDLTI